MTDIVQSEDLELVLAVASTGSVGAAARRLRITQPSASQRLARLERRAGLSLFDRDTRGARPTPAGAELARQASHILGHLTGALEAARAAGHHDVRRVGTIASLAERVLPVFDVSLAGVRVEQYVDHGERLVEWLEEGTLDAAVLAIAGQIELPASVRRHRIGQDELALFVPAGVTTPRRTTRPLRGAEVVFATYDSAVEPIRARLIALGAAPRRAATVQSALAIARLRSGLAVVPRSAIDRRARERVSGLPWRHRLTLDLVVPRQADPATLATIPALRRDIRLTETR